ncbi:MAG: spore coat protein [Candidatus Firestonebacteria bacterium RIFOXYA2_FULL_40_8]|nr:MAG: spore coat protein [Candidatus Firestonebacteria bacterium RIFOXYA2_FULL_40_8]
MKNFEFSKLFILEMANNHMGDVEHGLNIIREFKKVTQKYPEFNFAFKLQYRDLDTFIHPKYKGNKDIKYVKRFEETRLSHLDFKKLKDEIVKQGFIAICTPFDENSVDLVVEHGYDIIKVGSCSFTDWPLLEKIVKTDKPVILSTAGAVQNDIDRVFAFFDHREKKFAIMHCVGEYPTAKENFELNQIAFLKARYPNLVIGYSTHEPPEDTDSVKIAIGEGAEVFERHVGLKTEKYSVNAYSSTPLQIDNWLASAKEAYIMAGVKNKRRNISEKEKNDLTGLKRGVFAKNNIKKGEKLTNNNIYFAIPNVEGQLIPNELSKYTEYTVKNDISADAPLMTSDLEVKNLRGRFMQIVKSIRDILIKSNVPLPSKFEFELSHHYGIESFEKYGATIIRCINREYCKTIIITLPGQTNPAHSHQKKEETFQVLYGDFILEMNGETTEYKRGDIIVVERGVKHSFTSKTGTIFEEVSTTHYASDSFYDDEKIINNKDRKTVMTFWADWMEAPKIK